MKHLRFAVFSILLNAILLFSACTSTPERVPVLSEAQKAYQLMPRKERIGYFADKLKRAEMVKAGYHPMIYAIALPSPSGIFTLKEISQEKVKQKVLHEGALTIQIPAYILPKATAGKIAIQNLKIATAYQWTMISQGKTTTGVFCTEEMPPRLMRIDGVPNVRDLGGRIGLNGRRVRQGRIYRTAGLNDNASYNSLTIEGIMKEEKNPSPKMREAFKEYQRVAKKIKDKDFSAASSQPCTWDSSWTVFRPEGDDTFFSTAVLKEIASWTAIPAEFRESRGVAVTTNKDWIYTLPGKKQGIPAIFAKVFDSPREGKLHIGCGADWFLRLYVNGEKVFDTLIKGNDVWPISLLNHTVEINVRKGKNIIVAPMLSGAASFTFCCGISHREYADIARLEGEIRKMAGKTVVIGKNRLSPQMKDYIVSDLGIRSDIDLRSDRECYGMTGSPAGKEVTWFHYSSSCYGGMQSSSGKKSFAKVFRVFLDEKNYPVLFHCIAGQDRTGAVAFILNGLLGISEEQLYLDWESTGYWNRNANFNHERLFNKLVEGFETFPGKTLNEKIENYVYSLGFTHEDVTRFRAMMLEDK